MLCNNCLKSSKSKLQPDDVVLLEYLLTEGAITSQFSLSKKSIQDNLDLTIHKSTNSLMRLEILGMVNLPRGTKSNKYYITESGKRILKIIEDELKQTI